jgi:hypothetical protein
VVDTFIGQSVAFSLPIKQNDIDEFVKLWSDYDPEATGYITVDKLDPFLAALNKTEAGFFIRNKEEMEDDTQRVSFT